MPPHRFPLRPPYATPPTAPWRSARPEVCLSANLFSRGNDFALVYVSPNWFLIFKPLKTDNSLSLKQSVFLTGLSIRNLCPIEGRVSTRPTQTHTLVSTKWAKRTHGETSYVHLKLALLIHSGDIYKIKTLPPTPKTCKQPQNWYNKPKRSHLLSHQKSSWFRPGNKTNRVRFSMRIKKDGSSSYRFFYFTSL